MNRIGVGLCMGVAIGLGGCQSGPLFSSATKAPTTAPAETVTLRFSGWQSNPAEKQLLEQRIAAFEATHPTIRIKYEVITSEYMDVIKTRLIGDVAPDVFYLEAFEAPLLIQSGVLEPLNSYITPEFALADFEPSLVKAFQYRGTLYGIPKDFSTLALFYNQQAFAAAGISRPPQTWEELRRDSGKLTLDRNGDRKPEQYGFGIAAELARLVFMIQAFGGRLVDGQGYASFATPAGVKGLDLVVQQYRSDRTAAQPTDVGTTWGSEMMGQGKAAMVIEGPWSIPYFKETFPNLQFGVAEVPKINGKPGTMTFTVAYVINRKTRHKEAAWKFIAYLTGKEGMKAWAKQGLALPARKSVMAELGYDRDPIYAPFVRGAAYATIWQAGDFLPIIRTHFNNQFISALLGEQPLAAAMQKAQDTANREIKLAN